MLEVMSDVASRRASRAGWPGGLTTLERQTEAAIILRGSPGERIAMVWRVTLDAWASSGSPMPRYGRADMPGRVVRPSDG
jgi:hypothetical protein